MHPVTASPGLEGDVYLLDLNFNQCLAKGKKDPLKEPLNGSLKGTCNAFLVLFPG